MIESNHVDKQCNKSIRVRSQTEFENELGNKQQQRMTMNLSLEWFHRLLNHGKSNQYVGNGWIKLIGVE